MPVVTTSAPSAPPAPPPLLPPDRYPIWIGYDQAEGPDRAIVVGVNMSGGRFLAFVPAGVFAVAVAQAKGAAR